MKKPFTNRQAAEGFHSAFAERVSELLSKSREQFVSEDNVHRFNHGRGMQSHNSSFPDEVTTMKSYSHELTLPHEDVANYRTEKLNSLVTDLANEMIRTFETDLFKTLSDSCDRIGNVVEGKDKSVAESMCEVMEKIALAVGRDGEVSMPTMYVGSDVFEKMKLEQAAGVSPAINERLEAIKKSKIAQAHEEEAKRIARFNKEVE